MSCSFVVVGAKVYMFFIWEELYTACPPSENPVSQSGNRGKTKHLQMSSTWETPPKYFHKVSKTQSKICNRSSPLTRTMIES